MSLLQAETTWQNLLELSFLTASLLLIIIYHIVLTTIYYVVPNKSVLLTNLQVRKRWAVRMTEQHDVLAIQTLRNVLMASSFFGTSCMLVLIWCATEVVTTQVFVLPALDFTDSVNDQTFIKIKLIVIIFLLFFAVSYSYFSREFPSKYSYRPKVFSFTQAIRYCVHIGFFLNVGDTTHHTADAIKFVEKITFHFWIAMRSLYLVVPSFAYLIGPSWLLAASIILVITLQQADTIHMRDYVLYFVCYCKTRLSTVHDEYKEELGPILPK